MAFIKLDKAFLEVKLANVTKMLKMLTKLKFSIAFFNCF